jgi:NTP pyrophosphatase (non-canonical NTP hydrolase)
MNLTNDLVIRKIGIKMNKFAVNRMKTARQEEIMLICQEECAEVAQAISKVFRFGVDGEHLGSTNRERLEEEIGDLLCMIEMLTEEEIIDASVVARAAQAKRAKLAKWSNIKEMV